MVGTVGRLGMTLLLVVAVLPAGVVAADANTAATPPKEAVVEGALVPIPPTVEPSARDAMGDVGDAFGLEVADHLALLVVEDQIYFVSMSSEPEAGRATISGTLVPASDLAGDAGFIYADDVEVDRQGKQVSLADLQQNTEAYSGEVVEVSGEFSRVAGILDSEGVTGIFSGGAIGTDSAPKRLARPPGQAARRVTLNFSAASSDTYQYRSVASLLATVEGGVVGNQTEAMGSESWWVNSRVTVTILVVPGEFTGEPELRPLEYSPVSETTLSPSELQANGEQYQGDVVTVRGIGVGQSISTQELLLSVAQCAPEAVTVPGAGCVPAPTDVTVHAGVLADRDGGMVPYAGLSNQYQDVITESERGRYTLTGRVVDADQVDKRLESEYALIVYDRERTGDVDGAIRGEVRNKADEVTDALRAQLTETDEEYAAVATPTPSPTPSPSPIASAPATSQPTPSATATSESVDPDTGSDAKVVRTSTGNLSGQRLTFSPDLGTAGVQLAEVTVSLSGSGEANVRAAVYPERPPGTLPAAPGTGGTYLQVSPAADAAIDSGSVQLSISTDRIPPGAILRAYRYHEGGWQEVEVSAQRLDDQIRVVVETPGFSAFAVRATPGVAGTIPLPLPADQFGVVLLLLGVLGIGYATFRRSLPTPSFPTPSLPTPSLPSRSISDSEAGESTAAFEVEFGCSNCGDVWTEPFVRGQRVDQREGEVLVLNDEDTDMRIGCPTCDTTDAIGIVDRSPIQGSADGSSTRSRFFVRLFLLFLDTILYAVSVVVTAIATGLVIGGGAAAVGIDPVLPGMGAMVAIFAIGVYLDFKRDIRFFS